MTRADEHVTVTNLLLISCVYGADEHVTVTNSLLISCVYGTYGALSYHRIGRDGSVLTGRSQVPLH